MLILLFMISLNKDILNEKFTNNEKLLLRILCKTLYNRISVSAPLIGVSCSYDGEGQHNFGQCSEILLFNNLVDYKNIETNFINFIDAHSVFDGGCNVTNRFGIIKIFPFENPFATVRNYFYTKRWRLIEFELRWDDKDTKEKRDKFIDISCTMFSRTINLIKKSGKFKFPTISYFMNIRTNELGGMDNISDNNLVPFGLETLDIIFKGVDKITVTKINNIHPEIIFRPDKYQKNILDYFTDKCLMNLFGTTSISDIKNMMSEKIGFSYGICYFNLKEIKQILHNDPRTKEIFISEKELEFINDIPKKEFQKSRFHDARKQLSHYSEENKSENSDDSCSGYKMLSFSDKEETDDRRNIYNELSDNDESVDF